MSTIEIGGRGGVSRTGELARVAVGAMAHAFASVAMPPVCCMCGACGQASGLDLCDVCTTFLPVLDDGLTGEPIDPQRSEVPKLAVGGGTLVRNVFVFKYQYPVDHFIRGLKFRGELLYARVLGELMARSHCTRGGEAPACFVPIPLHLARFRERGFNQAHEIARYLGAALRVRVEAGVLVRVLPTKEQSGLSFEERCRNVRGAFEVVSGLPRGRIALLDDVVTTGSTAMAAAEALLVAGADEVELWAVARVEKDWDF